MGKLRGTPASPSALEERIRRIETYVKVSAGFIVPAAIAFTALVVKLIQNIE